MTTPNNGNTPSVQEDELASILASLEKLKETGTPEQKALLNHMASQHVAGMSSAEKAAEKELSVAELLAERAETYKAVMLALHKAVRDDGNTTDLVWTFRRHKNDLGKWVFNLTSVSGARGTNFLPALTAGFAMTFNGITFNYGKDGVDFVRDNPGNSHAYYKDVAREICRAMGANNSNNPNGLSVSSNGSAGTSLKRHLDKLGDDGTPGAKSDFHHQLDKVTVTHPTVNGGKPQKLSEYYLDYVVDNPDTGVEEPEAKKPSTS
jgi:hypothetical protein